jgi:hypothetical protein
MTLTGPHIEAAPEDAGPPPNWRFAKTCRLCIYYNPNGYVPSGTCDRYKDYRGILNPRPWNTSPSCICDDWEAGE